MTLRKPFLRALSGKRIDPPPAWIMRQAGRYLPEYQSLRAKAGDFLTLCYTPELAAEATLQPIRRFGFDAAIIFADILLLPHALGSDLRFDTGSGPVLSPILSEGDVDALRAPDSVHEMLSPVCETIRLTKASLPPDTALLGFSGSPWTTATYMIAGRGVHGQGPARRFLRRQPQAFERLIHLLTTATIEYLSDQISAGAEAVQLFDSWAGALDGAEFDRFITAPTAKIVRALKLRHPAVPVIAFPRQAGVRLPDFAAAAGADCIALDQSAEPAWLNGRIPPRICVQGNLDPAYLSSGGPALVSAARAVLEGFSDRPHIFNLGHGITPDARIENVELLLETVRAWKRAPGMSRITASGQGAAGS